MILLANPAPPPKIKEGYRERERRWVHGRGVDKCGKRRSDADMKGKRGRNTRGEGDRWLGANIRGIKRE